MSPKKRVFCIILTLAIPWFVLISKAQLPFPDYSLTILPDSPQKKIPAGKSDFSRLVWSDEFNTPGLPDSTKWSYVIGTGCPQNCGWGNHELEFYTSRAVNVGVEGGVLKLKAIREHYHDCEYTSAKLQTRNKFAFTYGKVEVRAKLPAGVGTWPAIWMMGNGPGYSSWPACGEIDIMEHRGFELNKIFGTLHYPGRSGENADGGFTMISDAATQFHTYSLVWNPSNLKIYVDKLLLHQVKNSESLPFNHNFYLILNLAMGGDFGGPVDPAFTDATMEVDYIRVYQ